MAVVGEHAANVVAHLLEGVPNFRLAPHDLCRVGEWPVMAVRLAAAGGAGMVGVVANGDDSLDVALEKLVHVLGRVCGNIDADVSQGADGEGMDGTGGVGTGALDIEQIAGDVAEDAFGHVGATGVAGAED